MVILERAANLNDEDLNLLIKIVRDNRNKTDRWQAFQASPIKEKLDAEYEITKASFLISGGLEATTREFLKGSKSRPNLEKYRSALMAAIPNRENASTANKSVARVVAGSNNLMACSDCGRQISKKASSCPNCGNPLNARSEKKGHTKNIKGNICPNCGDRNSYQTSEGGGCLLVGILFISIIGILLIPFLPKTWKCISCGYQWK